MFKKKNIVLTIFLLQVDILLQDCIEVPSIYSVCKVFPWLLRTQLRNEVAHVT